MDFESYVAANRSRLVRAAVLLGCSDNDAEDVVQTAMLRCYRSWHRVQSANHKDAYVFRVMVNCLRDAQARSWKAEIPRDTMPDSPVQRDETTGLIVRAALEDCSTEHREVLVLRYFADLTERQTAEALGVSVGTVKSRSSRAIRFLSSHPKLLKGVQGEI
jgi:RNA polymerase sigma-70 factor (sigma-E family)